MTNTDQTEMTGEKLYASDNPGVRFLIPVGCTGWAIASGYCGIFSFIPVLGFVLALLSIVFGGLAFSVISKNKHKHGIARVVVGWCIAIPSLLIHTVALIINLR